jgi:hypothetical protein
MADYDRTKIDQFLQDQIDTVPHLEALLLLWNSRPKPWLVEDMAKGLYLPPEATKEILDDLVLKKLIVNVSGACETYYYGSAPDQDELLAAVDSTYRRELIRISRMIHSKPSAALRAFAKAFRFKKDQK